MRECYKKNFQIYIEIYCIPNIVSSVLIQSRASEYYPKEYVKGENIVLSIGRLSEQKGFDIAVKAAAIMKQKDIGFKWYIIGNGELEKKLRQQIKENDVEDCFILLGVRENPYPYIQNCTVFAQTSRYEGKSVVLDEAKILQKPIVVTNYPTVKDQIRDGDEGVVVEMTSEAIAKAIACVLVDEDLRGKLNFYLSEREYGNEKEIEKYIAVIEGII